MRIAPRRRLGASANKRFVFSLPFTHEVMQLASETGKRTIAFRLPCCHLRQRGGLRKRRH